MQSHSSKTLKKKFQYTLAHLKATHFGDPHLLAFMQAVISQVHRFLLDNTFSSFCFAIAIVCAIASLTIMNGVHDLTSKIYDAIDNDDFDRAIRIGEKAELRAYALPQALLAYCYGIKKRLQDCLDTSRVVIRMRPVDEGTLNAVSAALKMCRKEDELATYYESLVAAYPQSAVYMQKLFAMHVKAGDGKRMQLLAQKLYKAEGHSKYLFWTVGSMLQQADLPPMMLTVAEKMLQKLFYAAAAPKADAKTTAAALAATTTQPGAEELELYLEVLKKQGKIAEALAAVKELYARPAGAAIKAGEQFQADGSCVKMHSLRFHSICAELCGKLVTAADSKDVKLGHINELKEIHRTILSMYPDQWSSHEELIALEVTSTLDGKCSAPQCDVAALLAHRAYTLEIHGKHSYLRGPLLAELRLLSVWMDAGNKTLPEGWVASVAPEGYDNSSSATRAVSVEIGVLLCRYFAKFQSKQCCFSDVKGTVEKIGRDAATLQALEKWSNLQRAALEKQLLDLLAAGQAVPDDEGGKSKKGKNKKGKAAEADTAASDEQRTQAVVLLCSHAKMGQLSAFAKLLTTGSVAVNNLAEDQVSTLAFFEKTRHLCAGSIGGDKEVQPGDEMLLLTSMRHTARTWFNSSLEVEHRKAHLDSFVAASHWCTLLAAGVQASPFSHAVKVEMLTPLRHLACGEMAWELFSDLKVRHVQTDSLSYLILPSLVESGMYTEARRQHMQVLAFHRAATRDTAEMIAESFQHANYTKALEMKKFEGYCTSSIQLALTNAEYPLLEIIDAFRGPGMWEEVAKYLEDYVAHDAMPVLDDQGLKGLRSNNDYSMLIRIDATEKTEVANVAWRTQQYYDRIREGQLAVRTLSAAINAEPDLAKCLLQKLMTHVRGRLSSTSSVFSGAAGSALQEVAALKASDTLEWSQELRCGGNVFELAVWNSVEQIILFCLAAAKMLQMTLTLDKGGDSEGAKAGEAGNSAGEVATQEPEKYAAALQTQTKEVLRQVPVCLASLQTVQGLLCTDVKDFRQTVPGDAVPLCPQWLQGGSFFTRTLAPWAALLLKAAHESFPKVGKAAGKATAGKAGDKNGEAEAEARTGSSSSSGSSSSGSSSSSSGGSSSGGSSSSSSATKVDEGEEASSGVISYDTVRDPVQQVSLAVKHVLDSLAKMLDMLMKVYAEEEDTMLTGKNVIALLKTCHSVGMDADSDAARVEMAGKLAAGQQTTVRRLRSVLQGLVEMLRAQH